MTKRGFSGVDAGCAIATIAQTIANIVAAKPLRARANNGATSVAKIPMLTAMAAIRLAPSAS